MITLKEDVNGKLIFVIDGMRISRGDMNTDRKCAPLIHVSDNIRKKYNIERIEITNNNFDCDNVRAIISMANKESK